MWVFDPNKIKERRKELGYSIRDIERMSNFHRSVISRIENGERSLLAERLAELANILKTPPGDFFSWVQKDVEK